jgi:hypothetical protein
MKKQKDTPLILLFISVLTSCAFNSVQNGIHEKYSLNKIQHNGDQYTEVGKEALFGLEQLQFTSYEGRESGKDYFIIWTKVAQKPFTITHFALDTSICKIKDKVVWIGKRSENELRLRLYKRIVEFSNGTCSLVIGEKQN